MDICTKCEKIILSDYKFCPRCGHSLFGDPHPGSGTGMDNIRAIKFFNVAQNLSTADNIDSLLGKIGNAVEELLDAERSSIMILDETGENLFFKSATGEEILKKLKIPLSKGIAGWIARTKKPIIVNDPYSDERFSPETDKATGFKTTSIVGAPMTAGGELIGVAEAINKRQGEFTQQDMDTMSGFAGLAAISIVNIRLKTNQKNLYSNMLDFLVMGCESLAAPEPTEKGHAWDMAKFAPQIGKELGYDLKTQQLLQNAALIHDIGFLGLENTELVGIRLQQELDNEARYRLHTLIGGEMIKGIKMMQEMVPFIQYHHRYKNNEGFPENMPSEKITPLMEVISILEHYFIVKDSAKVDDKRFSPEVYLAFKSIVP